MGGGAVSSDSSGSGCAFVRLTAVAYARWAGAARRTSCWRASMAARGRCRAGSKGGRLGEGPPWADDEAN